MEYDTKYKYKAKKYQQRTSFLAALLVDPPVGHYLNIKLGKARNIDLLPLKYYPYI